MIYLEGADNSGKTTLLKMLERDLARDDIQYGPGIRTPMINTDAGLQEQNHKAIFDRSRVISELVYGPIIRGKVRVSQKMIEEFYRATPLVIYCRPPLGKILDNGSREQMDGVLENHKEIVLAYDEMMKEMVRFGVRVVNYDWKNKSDYPKVLATIKRELQLNFERHCSALKLSGAK